ncbi:MAG: glycoside hydrolase family 3 N-terminal domain-containing protein [Pyrinomonadaceae bacterium]
MRFGRSLVLFVSLCVFAVAVFPADFRPGKRSEKFAEKTLKKMTLDEKIGQMVHIGVNPRFYNQTDSEFLRFKSLVADLNVGGIIVFKSGIYQSTRFLNLMQQASKYPLLVAADLETGSGMRFEEAENFPWAMGIAATGNPDFAERAGRITAREARAMGVHWVYAPVVDINNNPSNPVINVRSFGENPEEVARFGAAFAKGLQSGNVIATAKHFPGHGDTDVDSHSGLPRINLDRKRLDSFELVPFRKLVKDGVASVMISHISLPKLDDEPAKLLPNLPKSVFDGDTRNVENLTVPASLSKKIITGILRDEMSFDGLVVTDAMEMLGLSYFYEPKEAAVRAVEAGNDVLLKPASAKVAIDGIREAVKSGRISEDTIDRAVKRQLAWKHHLGLFKNAVVPLEAIDTIVSSRETTALATEISENAITLIKTDYKDLPLKPDSKIAVVAVTNGIDYASVGGPFVRTLRRNGFKPTRVALDERSGIEELEAAKKQVADADVVLLALFGRVRSGAENSVALPSAGDKLVKSLENSNKPVIAAAFGNPYLILKYPFLENYIVSYGDMEQLQIATADAISGRLQFKGRSPISIGGFPAGFLLETPESKLNIKK